MFGFFWRGFWGWWVAGCVRGACVDRLKGVKDG